MDLDVIGDGAEDRVVGPCGLQYTTKLPKALRTMRYESGGAQEWSVRDLGSVSAYRRSRPDLRVRLLDAILQMW